MAKNIVFPYVMFTQFVDEPNLKKLSLFFDSIYVDEVRLQNILTLNPKTESLNYEKATWQFLLEKSIVKTYPFQVTSDSRDQESNRLMNLLGSLVPQPNSKTSDEKNDLQKEEMHPLEKFFFAHDISARLDAIKLRQKSTEEFYPVFRTTRLIGSHEDRSEKKANIIQFLLNDIPEPSTETPWEQIVDFRSDLDVRNKYLAMINWVNRIAASEKCLNEIKEEYEYLYNDYMKHFNLHKLKYNNSLLEVVVTAGVGMLLALQAGHFATSFKNLIQMKLSHIDLVEQETKLPGKEVAYIYHAKEKFKKD